MAPRYVIGIDLAGPSNAAGTALARFEVRGQALAHLESGAGFSDASILDAVARSTGAGPTVVGLDAPLSYNDGGGDRPGDRALRAALRGVGLRSGSVMTPTMTRMAYLTLRGLGVARLLGTLDPAPALIEVHPGGAMALRGAPLEEVMGFSTQAASRRKLLRWFLSVGLQAVPTDTETPDEVAAMGAALATWGWANGDPAWFHPADPPHHPFPLCC